MARAMVLLRACSCVLLLTIITSGGVVEGIGVNWGSQTSKHMLPSIVVQLLKDNGIDKVKLFDADAWTVKAFAGSDIEVMVGIPNDQLKKFSESYDDCKDWVKENVTKHIYDGGVNLKYVAVGNEAFLKSYNGSYVKTTLPAMKNIQKALDEAHKDHKIKVTSPLNADVYESASGVPSDGNFRHDIRKTMLDMVRWMHSNKSPFLVNIYPFLSLYQNDGFPVDYAFFDGHSKPVHDEGHTYENMFDANLDTLAWSLKKAGVADLKIMVGEAGWPTDGDKHANTKLAKRFYDGFLKKYAAKKGTPLLPGQMEVYLFGLFDEDLKSIAPGAFERHWGIFRYDGQPKFAIDFSGKSTDKFPVAAKGVQYQAKQWCVFNKDVKNESLILANLEYACSHSDCTALGYGSSCNGLDRAGNISYAFNMYFQMNDQSVEACDFQGLASITKKNASTGTCLFPVQIQSAATSLRIVSAITLAAFLLTFLALF